jgi:hypothetical protein
MKCKGHTVFGRRAIGWGLRECASSCKTTQSNLGFKSKHLISAAQLLSCSHR